MVISLGMICGCKGLRQHAGSQHECGNSKLKILPYVALSFPWGLCFHSQSPQTLPFCFLAMQLSLILAFATATSAACNGHDELCRRKYSDITFIGTHNSAFVGQLPVHNHYISVAEQLDLGVRFLQAQTQDKDGDI